VSKTKRYAEFQEFENCYTLHHDDSSVDLELDSSKDLILELGCGSGVYTLELAKRFPDKQFIGIDTKSDRLHFGAEYALEHDISNTKRLWASVDHITRCFPPSSVDEVWITFPDPRPGRDRQKLSSPKYLKIYQALLKPGGIIHIKTDDKSFFDYSQEVLPTGGFEILGTQEDIYNNQKTDAEHLIGIQTYYEKKWLEEKRKVYYLRAQLRSAAE
jgi:tRNA (guanine-N7-)-methyltransferase